MTARRRTDHEIGRRALLSAGLASGAVLLPWVISGCAATAPTTASTPASASSTRPTTIPSVPVPPPGPELANPPALRSVNGVLAVDLQARRAVVDLGVGHPVTTYTYGGTVPGSTWEMRAGDTLKVHLRNDLPALPEAMNMMRPNRPHQWTTTNLHTHGLHVSPKAKADNPFLSVAPGTDFDIEIPLPKDHTAGLYWYHPHRHGATCQQLRAGMAGAIVVRGDIDEVPEVAAAKERMLFLQAIEVGADYALPDPIPDPTKAQAYFPRAHIFWTVNGTMNPTITLYPGEVQRWRIANAAEGKLAGLRLAGHQFHQIAWDGLTLTSPVTSDALQLAAANRVEVLVQAGKPGTYTLVLDPGSSQHPNMIGMESASDDQSTQELAPRTVATIIVKGSGPTMSLPTSLPGYNPPIHPIAATRTVRYTVDRDPTGEFISFGINGKPFADANPPYQAKLGTAEEWTVVNDSDDQHVHSFHIHVNPYKVTAVNGKPLAVPVWRDTYLLPAGKGGSFTFQTNFDDFTGTFVEHCHVVSHEDLGMMESIEVIA